MIDRGAEFGPFEDVWLNCAHQGPLPRTAVEAAREAIAWKSDPGRLSEGLFFEVPDRLREALARLVGGEPEGIVLGNSASYGLQVLVDSIGWRDGDEVLLVDGDFPATQLPWTALESRGVRVRLLEAAGAQPTPGEVTAALGESTRVVCLSWVNSFTGALADLEGLARACDARGTWLVVNASQGLGALPMDVSALRPAALTCCGFKWLCGPYGTGFLWLREDVLSALEPGRRYWLAWQRGRPLDQIRRCTFEPPPDLGVRAFDVFGTANFLNYWTWRASIECLLDVGPEEILAHDRALSEHLHERLDPERWELRTPGESWSPLRVVSHADPALNPRAVEALREAGVRVALREGNVRVTPHLYNTVEEVDRLVEVLNRVGD